MMYQLYEAKDRQLMATHEAEDDFLAEKWAREWAIAQASGEDYTIKRANGNYAASLFRTVAGQWYIMRQ